MNAPLCTASVLVLAALGFAGCTSGGPSVSESNALAATEAEIEVVEQGWTGWVEEQPGPITNEHRVVVGDRVVLGGTGPDAWIMDVDRLSDGSMTVSVNNVARRDGDEWTGCDDQSFELAVDETATFATCTLDGGSEWTVTYLG